MPTRNYEVVHTRRALTIHDNERYVRGVVEQLTRRHEAGEVRTWKMSDSARAHIHTMLRDIVCVEIAFT